MTGGYPGITSSEGKTNEEQRKFMISTMNKMNNSAEGKTLIEDTVAREADVLVEAFRKESKSGPVAIKGRFLTPVNNIVMTITAGRDTRKP